MNDHAAMSMKKPLLVGDVLLILLAMALFVFALQPRKHAHGARRREVDPSAEVASASPGPRWQRYEAEALEDTVVRPSFLASM
jgi:hypothetical protein